MLKKLMELAYKVINAKIGRLEVVSQEGRLASYSIQDLKFSYQDEGKTLKIFITTPE